MFGRKQANISKSGVDYGKLGRGLEDVLVKDYLYYIGSTRRQIWAAFLRGIFMGLGGVIGATLVVAILLFILHQLGGLPLLGPLFQNIGTYISPK